MKKQFFIVGVDLSKLTIDVCIHSVGVVEQFKNNSKGFKEMWQWFLKNFDKTDFENLFVVMEHTGDYGHRFCRFLESRTTPYSLVPGLAIRRSLGIVRGKNDKLDATRIALYGNRLKEEIKPAQLPEKRIIQLKKLRRMIERYTQQRAGYKRSLCELKATHKLSDHKAVVESQKKLIAFYTKEIAKLEAEIKQILSADKTMMNNYKLVTSIKGVGPKTALSMIIYTHNFKKFTEWRKFSSYCGTAPFPYQSGTSIKGRSKVSHLANKTLKVLLNMCAWSAIQHNHEIRTYYHKRLDQGDAKTSAINIVRNKLISRIFAVVKRQSPYVDIYKHAA